MLKIKDLIAQRQMFERRQDSFQHDFSFREGAWLKYVITEAPGDEAFFVTSESDCALDLLEREYGKEWQAIGVYMLGFLHEGFNERYYVVHLSKRAENELKFALFNIKRDDESSKRDWHTQSDASSEDWARYVVQLEQWINEGVVPSDNEMCEFNVVSRDKLYKGSLHPELYSKEKINTRDFIDEQNTKGLSEVADVLWSYTCFTDENRVKVLELDDLSKPHEIANIKNGQSTSVILEKGDVIIPRDSHFGKISPYLFDYEGEEKVYAPASSYVIRCKSVLPEYIYLYLCTDIGIKVLKSFSVGDFYVHITTEDLAGFPIAPPTEDEHEFASNCYELISTHDRDYACLQMFNNRRTRIFCSVSGGLNSLISRQIANYISRSCDMKLKEIFEDDLEELNGCLSHSLYKAALALAGAVLEAFLIDWLSELDGVNYFESNGSKTLNDYIQALENRYQTKNVDWSEERNLAHNIRRNRNLIHPKNARHVVKITQIDCEDVVSNLLTLIDLRK